MNEVLEAIRTRRSVKNYRAEPVPNDLLSEIVSAGTYAASGMNRQSPIILNITDRTVRDMLSDLNRRVGGWQEGFDPFYGAPNVLCVLADKAVGTYLYDGSLVMGNLMLRARTRSFKLLDSPCKRGFRNARGKSDTPKARYNGRL